MKKVCVFAVVIAVVALALGCTANAREMRGKTSVEVDFGYSAFVFSGIADLYDSWEIALTGAGWTLTEKRAPSSAIPYGAKFKYGLSPTVSVTGSVGAFSSGGRLAVSINWPAELTIDTAVSATVIGAGVQVVLVDPPEFNIFAELEILSWAVTYHETWRETGISPGTDTREAAGSKIGGALAIGGQYFLPNSSISLIGKIMYRAGKLAQITTTRDDFMPSNVGQPLQTLDPVTHGDKDMQIDLGGLGVLFGVCFPIFAEK